MSIDSDLAALARFQGVAVEYRTQVGVLKEVSAHTVRAVLAALGVDASTPKACRKALAELKNRYWESVLPPVIVLRHGRDADAGPWETWVHLAAGSSVRVWVDLEDGGERHDIVRTDRRVDPGSVDGQRIEEVIYRIPRDLPLGWHRLIAQIDGVESSCSLVVTPERLELPAAIHERRGWGVATQLYSMRSKRSWGLGDLADLRDLASWLGREHGSDFILVNPLHACAPTPPLEASPYLPVTRRYANPLYIRVEEVVEYPYLPISERVTVDKLIMPLHRADLTADLLDRDATWQVKRTALEFVHAVPRSPGRQAEYADYLKSEGAGLDGFATWCALAEEQGPRWNEWPIELQDPASPQVAAHAKRLAERIEFYRWLQWILDLQMADAQRTAREAGMEIGIMHDIAVGVHPFGSDTWTSPDVIARHVSVGAPPDAFNQIGQDWSQPPPRPDKLAATAYESYRDMLRTLLRHSGGLRIDHVLGLFRLWWIPEGMPSSMGTYVNYDHHAMVDILVLEAHRTGALVVGEDMGTVEPWVREFLAERGILGTTVLWFEHEEGESGTPRPPEQWRANAMASVTVHDIPPTRGYLAGEHVKLRDELKLLGRPVDEEMADHEASVQAWRELLTSKGMLRAGAGTSEFVVALYRALTWSPSRLLLVSLPDLVGDQRTQNQPGTMFEYPNWRIPLCNSVGEPVLLEDLPSYKFVNTVVSAVGGSTRS